MKAKKLLSVILTLAMAISLLQGVALPASATEASAYLSVVDIESAYDATQAEL